jgi:hypothetical protein
MENRQMIKKEKISTIVGVTFELLLALLYVIYVLVAHAIAAVVVATLLYLVVNVLAGNI